MRINLLGVEYELTSGADAMGFLSLMAEKVNWLKGQVVKIGNDTLTTANKLRETGEWIRRNWQGGAAVANNAAIPAVAALGLLGGQQQQQTQPSPQPPVPQPPADPHKNTGIPPTIPPASIANSLTAGGGTVVIMAPPAGPQPTDRTFWVQIDAQAGSVLAGVPICAIDFGTDYQKPPTIHNTVSSSNANVISPVNITTQGFTLVSPTPILAFQVFTVLISVEPTAGDSTF